jgi:uncharacterized membrane protein
VGTAPRHASPQSSGLEQNIAGLLCWLPLGPIPILASLFFLVAEPYKSNKFIRFHAAQSIFTLVALVALAVGLMIFGSILTLIFPPLILVMLPIWWAFGLASIVLFAYMAFKAYSLESPKLPYVGEMVTKYVDV